MKKLLLIIPLLLGAIAAEAIDFRTYKLNPSSGLNSTVIRDITQDDNGYMWFATIHGLCRYDGYTMKQVITSQDINNDLVPDYRTFTVQRWGSRFLWVALRGNMYCCYDLHQNKFVNYTGDKRIFDVYGEAYVGCEKEVWLYDAQKGCRRIAFDGDQFQINDYATGNRQLPSNHVNFVRLGLQERMWIGTDKGLVLSNNGRLSAVGPKGKDVRQLVVLNADEYFICADGSVWYYRQGKLSAAGKSQAALPIIKGAIALTNSILIATGEGIFEYQIASHTLNPSGLTVTGDCDVQYDKVGNAIIWNKAGDAVYVRKMDKKVFATRLSTTEGQQISGLKMSTTPQGYVWITTNGQGLYVYVPETGEVTHYLQAKGVAAPINTNYLLANFVDSDGDLWISQEDIGLSHIRPLFDGFTYYPFFNSQDGDAHDMATRMVRKTKSGRVYVANFSHNLFTFDGQKLTEVNNPYGSILAVAESTGGQLCLGTRSGVVVGNRVYRHDANDVQSLSSDKVSDVCLDKQGRMWLAAYDGGLDLAVPDNDKGYVFRHFLTDNEARRQSRVITLDHHGRLWVGTGEGCFVFNPNELIHSPNKYQQLTVNKNKMMDEVHAIFEDSRHRVWVAISGTGVACYDNSSASPQLLRVYTPEDGLGDKAVQSIVEDNKHYICVGTNRGLSVFDEKKQAFVNFLPGGTPRGNIFIENSACRLSDGRLVLGTKEGLVVVEPEKVDRSKRNHKTAITDVLVNGVSISEISPENGALSYTKSITLSYDQNSLTFHFSNFSFEDARNSQYSYMLKGYDEEWSMPSNSNEATYKNLSPGTYTLLLRASQTDEWWSDETVELTIEIRPPFWLTWWAILCYIVLATALGYVIYRQVRRVAGLRNKIKVENQLTEYKLQFFTNITHEFRTPLTIIKGAVDRMSEKENVPADFKQPLSSMHKGIGRLMRLLSHLLEFRKVQTHRSQLQVEETDVIHFLRDVYSSFRDVAENKQINFLFSTFARSYTVPVDRRKIEMMANNLISNALKYTPAKGHVSVAVKLSEDSRQLLMEVSDTGIGVSKEKRELLFKQFMQSTFSYDSMGIGLYLSGQLAQLHKGNITYRENEGGQGSVFTLSIPADKSVYTEKDFAEPIGNTFLEEKEEDSNWLKSYRETAPKPLNDRHLLIVEDDSDICEHLELELRHLFEVSVANDGKEAIQMMRENKPDLVVSDVMMPNMNGTELVKQMKSDENLNDIPVILISAVSDEGKRTRAYEVGADEFIQKPFSMKMLAMRCSQLIMQRDKLKTKYAAQEAAPVQAVLMKDRDKRFIDVLDQWLYSHLSDPTLNVDELAEKMGYGRSTFYRKLNALTGVTPNVYIRNMRMEKSRELLDEGKLTVSEISYQVGFSSPFYFSKCFKEQFGMSPSQYKKGV